MFQKLPKAVAESVHMPSNGHFGVRLGERGCVTTVPYNTDPNDGRIILAGQAWKEFLKGKNLGVGQVILVTMMNTLRCDLDMTW